jgi:hypothetical protein
METTIPIQNQSPNRNQHATESDTEARLKLVDMPVTNQNEALNLLIAFLTVAQKRGVFNIQESAKLWDCINMFTDDKK